MCGISGIYHFKNSKTVNESVLTGMRDTLIHRGPDSGANYISPDRKVGLSQRRLAVIDLSNEAACPMKNEDGTLWITYNGEVYNFKPLREELLRRGHKFETRGDTEVILHGYEEWGPDVVKKLNGMFAFVVWDERKKTFFAARDHMGIKPFFYAVQNGTFYFGSEIKAILAHPEFKKELNEQGISYYLTFSTTPAPHTLFRDVRKLPAAHRLLIRPDGSLEEDEYWNPIADAQHQNANLKNQNEAEQYYIEETRRLLTDSIQAQMVSDVPFGCFLSGGIDSSINATLMSRALGHPVETFSVGYKDFNEKNEFEYSRMVAKSLGTNPHELLLDESHMRDFLPLYGKYADDPNGDQVCFPLFWLSELTKKSGVTVVQIGEGSDELFSGYRTYVRAVALQKKWELFKKLPKSLRTTVLKGVMGLNAARLDFGKEYIRRFQNDEEPFWGLAVAFGDHAKEGLVTSELRNSTAPSYGFIESLYEELRGKSPRADFLTQMTYIEIKNRLPELLLARADKMTMAHSLEGRVPFLDTRLVELAFRMPAAVKIKGGEPKYVLKKAAEGIIPREIQKDIIWRKKQGFANPISEWLKPDYAIADTLMNVIYNSKLRERKFLNYDYVRYLADAHQKNKADHNFRLWNLVTLSLWYDEWF